VPGQSAPQSSSACGRLAGRDSGRRSAQPAFFPGVTTRAWSSRRWYPCGNFHRTGVAGRSGHLQRGHLRRSRRGFLIRNGRLRRPPMVSSSSRWPVGLPTSSALDEPPPSGLVRPGPGRYPFAPQPSRWTAAGNLVTMTPPAPLGAPSRWPHAPSPTTPPAARSLGPRGRSNTDYTCHDSSNRVSRATANSATVSGVTTSA